MSDRFRIPSIVFVPVMAAALFLPMFPRGPDSVGFRREAGGKYKNLDCAAHSGRPAGPSGILDQLDLSPLHRPAKYGGRESTDEELSQTFKQGVQQTYETTYGKTADTPEYDPTVYALGAWQNGVKPNKRTSLIVDPPDGRIPPLRQRVRG